MEPILKVSDLTKTFEDRKKEKFYAVDHVSFQMMPGQTLGIVGESGSGKSTLARLLCCLEKPDGGVLSLCGQEIGDTKRKKIERSAGKFKWFSGSGQLFRPAPDAGGRDRGKSQKCRSSPERSREEGKAAAGAVRSSGRVCKTISA